MNKRGKNATWKEIIKWRKKTERKKWRDETSFWARKAKAKRKTNTKIIGDKTKRINDEENLWGWSSRKVAFGVTTKRAELWYDGINSGSWWKRNLEEKNGNLRKGKAGTGIWKSIKIGWNG